MALIHFIIITFLDISNESNLLKKNAEKQLKTDKKNKKAVDENIIKSKVVTIDVLKENFFIF